MAWPHNTIEKLLKAGYTLREVTTCTGPDCGRAIEKWNTPKGKVIPLDCDTHEPHFASCKNVERFRR